MSRGFTLLEVLVAMTILGLAIVTLIQLSSQGLRLLRLSDDHQQAVLLADRLARTTEIRSEGVDGGQEGRFQLGAARRARAGARRADARARARSPASTRSRSRCAGASNAHVRAREPPRRRPGAPAEP